MTLKAEFNYNFIPLFKDEVKFPVEDPNTPYHLNQLNKRVNEFCREFFEKIKKFASDDMCRNVPKFTATFHESSIPPQVTEEIKKIFGKMEINFEYSTHAFYACGVFDDVLKTDKIPRVSIKATWKYDNPYLFTVNTPEVKKPTYVYTKDEHLKVFWQAAVKSDGTDVAFKVGEKKFPAHRCFISKHSEVIDKLLTRMKEASQSEIEILEDAPEWFYCLLYFIYNGALPPEQKLTLHTLDKINQIADKYNVKPLCLLSQDLFEVEYAIVVITKENFSEIFEMASRRGDKGLMQKCLNFASQSDETLEQLASKVDDTNLLFVLQTGLKRAQPPQDQQPNKKQCQDAVR